MQQRRVACQPAFRALDILSPELLQKFALRVHGNTGGGEHAPAPSGEWDKLGGEEYVAAFGGVQIVRVVKAFHVRDQWLSHSWNILHT